MVHVIRKIAKQGHPVPDHSYIAHGPFDSELFRESPIQYPDNQPEEPSTQLYLCRGCNSELYEDELDDHDCNDYL